VIDTDSGLVRELSSGYAAEHLEHAYALTGHGMQGGTVETATVIASPHDLTAGWSYTALSRARGHTHLLIYQDAYAEECSEFAPTAHTPPATRDELLARVARRMLERDDEDLAIEQLPGAGRADAETAETTSSQGEPRQERAGASAQTPAFATVERLHKLTDRIQRLRTQVGALSTRQLQRIDDLDARAITLATQREQITRRRDDLPEPRRRLGREQDPNPVERAHLTSALKAAERELDAVLTQRERLARELGDPSEIRAERDALQLALTKLTREHTQTLDLLAERELGAPGVWATRALGERPAEPQLRKEWDRTVREAARYRLHYDISDTENPLGPQPEPREQQRDWQRAREVLDRSARRLGRDVDLDQDFTVGMGR
jgi:hypothetical protein